MLLIVVSCLMMKIFVNPFIGYLFCSPVMPMERDTILIIDEAGFSRVCSAILEAEGYCAQTIPHESPVVQPVFNDEIGLVITSYPYGSRFFEELYRFSLPIIVLTDHISKELISALEGFENSICLMKPLDYQKFTKLVKQMMAGTHTSQGGYSIV